MYVHVVNNDVIKDGNGIEQEKLGIEFLTQIHNHSLWKQTSYNANFRGQYAGAGMIYDPVKDEFTTPTVEEN